MQLNEEKGGYAMGAVVRLYGSFRTNEADAPDRKRDGRSNSFTVVRTSAGLFTVTFDAGVTLPEKLVAKFADVARVAAPTTAIQAHIVELSYNPATRVIQIATVGPTAADDTTPVAADPDDLDVISFELVGSISSAGTDPA